MCSESIAQAIYSEAMMAKGIIVLVIVLVGQKYRDKTA